MKQSEYKATLKKLDMGPADVQRVFKVGQRTPHNWAACQTLPQHVAVILRMMLRYKLSPGLVASEFGD